jgi:hypothetical protein
MIRDEETIPRTFSEYLEAFQTLDPSAVLPYCHVPCPSCWPGPVGTVGAWIRLSPAPSGN